jgi:peptidyl-tRNA hydrolase, PTH1 family
MKLIVGLGNVGERYANTRHNVGFKILDDVCRELGVREFHQHRSIFADAEIAHERRRGYFLLKPLTMMNLSGQAVAAYARYYKIAPKDVWVIYDEFELPFGTVRVRQGGGSAGHNGVKSVIEHLSEDFGRIRFGVGNPSLRNPIAPDRFVLGDFTKDEQPDLPKLITQTTEIVLDRLDSGDLEDTTYRLIEPK